MKTILEDGRIKLECSDWRYSAAILGLIRYFDHNYLDYEAVDDYIIYDKQNIKKEYYVNYILERYKNTDFSYIYLINKLSKDTYTTDEIKEINKYMKSSNATAAIQNLNLEFDGTNQEDLLKVLKDNKLDLVLTIFNNRQKCGYTKFCNNGNNSLEKSKLFKEDDKICRLIGFYVDLGKKRNLLTWNASQETLDSEDIQEFDFIPFAFSLDYTSIFINNNFSIQSLIKSNSHFNEQPSRISLYKYIAELSDKNLCNNIEVIIRDENTTYYQTLFIDKTIINELKLIHKIENIAILEKLKIKVRDSFYIDFQYLLTLIFNRQYLDSVIHLILKNKNFYENYQYYLSIIIQINMILYQKGKNMTDKYKSVYACAKTISSKLEENKLNTYRQKLINYISADNKTDIYNTLLQLSNYSQTNINFMFDILEDYSMNKNLIYAFIASLNKSQKKENEV